MRIVSLVPSVTETLSAWDRTPLACTRFCERADLEHVGGTKDPDVTRIVELRPDLVIVDAEENRREDYDALVQSGLDVHVLRITSLFDVDRSMATLAERVGATWEPFEPGESLPVRLRAFIPIWRRPWIALGTATYGASLLAHLGVVTVFDADGPYPQTELEAVANRRPEVVIAPSEPYPFGERQRLELEGLAPTRFVDGKDLFWWGQRTSSALVRLRNEFADS